MRHTITTAVLAALALTACGTDPTPAPTTTPAETTAPPAPAVEYANCDEAIAAGAAPLTAGDPGYRAALDGDGDGTACETEAAVDPYDTYQQLIADNDIDPIDISPEDAQTRALLGCGTEWAPDTVDWALQQAYADVIASNGCPG